MLSSEAEVKDRIRGLQTGADDYVGKPYDTGYVLSRARELLHGRQGTPAKEKASILVIDDSPTFRNELREALERSGQSVLTASSGEEGLRIAADNRPAAIVVDGVMPGIDGGTVIRRLRLDAALRGTPCLLLTASEDSGAELRALDSGADAFARKDEHLDVILARLAAVLRSAGMDRGDTKSLLGPKRVMAVDDSSTYLNELAGMLREEGYDVVLARSGEEAIEMLSVQSVDCILLDLVMPGIDGKEVCRRVKSSPQVRDIPLIMLTALEDREAMIEGLSVGADDFISKSSEFSVLKARVRAQLRRKQFEDEHRRVREELLRKELEASEARAASRVAETKAALAEELERKNNELEAFSYSVSHDLRSPLRSIDGFSKALLDDYGELLDEGGQTHLRRIRTATQRMGSLIDDLLNLSRVSRASLTRLPVSLSELVLSVKGDLERREIGAQRNVTFEIEPDVVVEADSNLMRVAFENLIGNAWKFTSKTAEPRIEFGTSRGEDQTIYFVRDNGAGFDMSYVQTLFKPFQRLHREGDFPGTGIGLATVHRIIDRHGGRVWAEAEQGKGATIFFTVPPPRPLPRS
jgi:DNA-binding response OmpR family regulator